MSSSKPSSLSNGEKLTSIVNRSSGSSRRIGRIGDIKPLSRHRAGARPTAPTARTQPGPGSRDPTDDRPPGYTLQRQIKALPPAHQDIARPRSVCQGQLTGCVPSCADGQAPLSARWTEGPRYGIRLRLIPASWTISPWCPSLATPSTSLTRSASSARIGEPRALVALRRVRLSDAPPAAPASCDPFQRLLVRARGGVVIDQQAILASAEED